MLPLLSTSRKAQKIMYIKIKSLMYEKEETLSFLVITKISWHTRPVISTMLNSPGVRLLKEGKRLLI